MSEVLATVPSGVLRRELVLLRFLSIFSQVHLLIAAVYGGIVLAYRLQFIDLEVVARAWLPISWPLFGMGSSVAGAFVALLLVSRAKRHQDLGPGIHCYTIRVALRLIASIGVLGISLNHPLDSSGISAELSLWSNITIICIFAITIRSFGMVFEKYQKEKEALRRFVTQLNIGEPSALKREFEFNRLRIFHRVPNGKLPLWRFVVGS